MIFTQKDRQQLDNAANAAHGNRTMLHDINSEVADMSRLLKRLEIIIEQTANDLLQLSSHVKQIKPPPKPSHKAKPKA